MLYYVTMLYQPVQYLLGQALLAERADETSSFAGSAPDVTCQGHVFLGFLGMMMGHVVTSNLVNRVHDDVL